MRGTVGGNKEKKIPVFKDVLEVRMSGIGYFSDIDDFFLEFDVRTICKSKGDSLEIFPDSIEVWICQSRLDSLRGKLYDISTDDKETIYECRFFVETNPRECIIELIKNDQLESNFLKFYIGNMIYYNGKKVDIDTIYAYDPKAKWFKDYSNY